jgi:hypothetical protein
MLTITPKTEKPTTQKRRSARKVHYSRYRHKSRLLNQPNRMRENFFTTTPLELAGLATSVGLPHGNWMAVVLMLRFSQLDSHTSKPAGLSYRNCTIGEIPAKNLATANRILIR